MVLNATCRSANTKILFGSFQMVHVHVVQLIQNPVLILPSGESMDPLKPFEWIWMVVQLATDTVQMVSPCVYKTNVHFWKWKFWMVLNGLSVGGLIMAMGTGPGSPFGLEDKAPWISWMFNFGGFTDSPHPHRQETRGLDTIQFSIRGGYCTFVISLLSRKFWAKGRLVKTKILKNNRPGANFIELLSREFYKAEYQPHCIHFVWKFGW